MSKIYFTLTGTNHYFGKEFLKKGAKIRLEKEPDNEYDKEAIKVTYEGLGKIGYVANSSYTVIGDSMLSLIHISMEKEVVFLRMRWISFSSSPS